ncbi:unnamed protein product [Urochloa decumbens]|uniref:Uncharacterized protein n=1 Tax=Urochloa decumbens TaxID=240449 RepID=A0ABC9G2X4_9POAL
MEATTETDTREETLAEKLERLKEQAKDFASKHPVAVAAAVAVVGAVGAYFLWPREESPADGRTMKAPGSGGRVVSRKAFEEKKQPYFKVFRTDGAEAAVSFLSRPN